MTKPNFKVKTLKEAREELAKFGITEKAPTLGHARKLLLAKRAEISKAKATDQTNHIENEATSTVATIAPLATAKAVPLTKPAVFNVHNYLALRVKHISGVWMSKAELAILSVSNDATFQIEAAISTLSKTTDYHEGVLLSNAHTTLQKHELTKDIDPRDILNELKTSKAIKAKSDREAKALSSWWTSSK